MPGTNLTRQEAIARRGVVVGTPDYRVSLDVTKGPETFDSTTVVTFEAVPGSSTFLDLTADEVQSVTLNGEALAVSEVYADSRIELAGLKEANTVTVTARGRYSKTGEGLQRTLDPADGNVYLYTQFEVPDARRVYAVFDQPDIKSTFTFDVKAPASWLALSNTPVAGSDEVPGALTEPGTLADRPAEGVRHWRFETTPVMSSYLTALAIGPYVERRSTYANPDGRTIDMGLYCRRTLGDALERDADYLFDVTKKGFTFFAAQWDVPYPYAKYDQVFAPEYNSGAMENIGLVIVHDRFMFSSKVNDFDLEDRDRTLLHELAHMWFGDLVTMKWWNDLWLNESFATFMGYLAGCEAVGWPDDWASFCSCQKYATIDADQRPTTHPVVAPINDLNDTYVNFDGITYAKGASVLKQLVAYVGRDKFFEGIHNYLNRYAYSNATLADLLAELEKTSGRDLTAWSAQWLERSGINTITTEVEENEDGTIASLTLRQTAPAEHPVLRAHRLAVGFYNEDPATGAIVRTDRFELDVDGETTVVEAAAGKPRPALILVNDDDLTYTKLRFDDKSLAFAAENLHCFSDALARSVIWLAFWDMTRDGELPAKRFIDTSLAALATEHESTTFRYALSQISTTAWHYTAPAERAAVVEHVAAELWKLAEAAKAGSDEQFQLVTAYLGYGEEGDEAFAANAKGLLDGTVTLDGLEIDNNFTWTIVNALASVNVLDEAGIEAQLAKRDTTENREFALGAKAVRGTAEAKAWAWDQALHNADLTNSQLEAVARGFAATPRADLAEPYAGTYFEVIDWVWKNKTFHMAEALLEGLYPVYADPAGLVSLGEAWLASHEDADNALKRLIRGNVESSQRTLKVRDFNAAL